MADKSAGPRDAAVRWLAKGICGLLCGESQDLAAGEQRVPAATARYNESPGRVDCGLPLRTLFV